jgi:hypothetical protein
MNPSTLAVTASFAFFGACGVDPAVRHCKQELTTGRARLAALDPSFSTASITTHCGFGCEVQLRKGDGQHWRLWFGWQPDLPLGERGPAETTKPVEAGWRCAATDDGLPVECSKPGWKRYAATIEPPMVASSAAREILKRSQPFLPT